MGVGRLAPHRIRARYAKALAEIDPPVFGYVTGLDSGEPEFHVTAIEHVSWARAAGRIAQIKREAMSAWRAAFRECEG